MDAAGAEAREARSRYDAAAAKVTDKKAMLKAMDNYRNTDPVIKEYRMIRKEKDKQKFYAAHEADFIINDAAKHQLDKLGVPKQLPKRKDVVAEIQSLISEKNECYNDYREKSDRLHELMTMQRNYQMSMPQPKRGHSHEQERQKAKCRTGFPMRHNAHFPNRSLCVPVLESVSTRTSPSTR